jgi:dTDP-4-amino-4,6-dideoxygalactose transaminase
MTEPLTDLASAHAELAEPLREAFDRVVGDGRFVDGPDVEAFEREWARACGTAAAVGLSNGTDALALALEALGVAPGAEVVVPAFTFVATAEAVVRLGARPVLADVRPDSPTLDPGRLSEAVTARTRAVVAVHLHGRLADVAGVEVALGASGYGDVPVVEDAAQAHGATTPSGRRAGSLGNAAAFSFYPAKPLGALGDAGAVTTDDEALAQVVAQLRDHGRTGHHVHTRPGTTARLDALQAAFLRVKLARLDDWNERRREAARRYRHLLGGISDLELPPDPEGDVPALFVVRSSRRDELAAALAAAGIATGLHYPMPVHRQPAFAGLGAGRSLACSEAWASTVLSLPMHPHLRPEVQDRVAEVVRTTIGTA